MSPPAIAFVSTYPPTRCGLATFTASLSASVRAVGARVGVVRVVDEPIIDRDPPEVVARLVNGSAAARNQVAEVLADYDVVCVQHEYGIYGGPSGAEVLDVIASSPVPVITVLHTVLAQPTAEQRDVLDAVCESSSHLVVMSEATRERLCTIYGVRRERVSVIPHGARRNPGPPPLSRPTHTALTWGLLGPGKGIEWAIDAIALLGDLDPAPHYHVVGDLHPKVVERDGTAYLDALRARARARGVADRVHFIGGYRDPDELLELIHAADVVVLPYETREQVTSGVLVEALAAGRLVVASQFPHAVELLSPGAGSAVRHEDPQAIAAALRQLLNDPEHARMTAWRASETAKAFEWPKVAARHVALASEVAASRRPVLA